MRRTFLLWTVTFLIKDLVRPSWKIQDTPEMSLPEQQCGMTMSMLDVAAAIYHHQGAKVLEKHHAGVSQ